ncbi:acetate/propionate family kinase [Parasediminibacterium sp. JCM 36343]|uniref:acetate/propionate family kinase n=1 Tax=Parasediminibacterium sp. JCM 36343 TaxID=3374279 RepID=UPI003979B680
MILTINGGSSSIKFAFYSIDGLFTKLLFGQIESIGSAKATLSFQNTIAGQKKTIPAQAANYDEAAKLLVSLLEKQQEFTSIIAIGHRIVHGMQHTAPEKITPALLAELKQISSYDPEHLPEEIKLIELFGKHYPQLPQIACFDTSFHSKMPLVAKMLPIPRRYFAKGIQRYGFHGLSYTYLMGELQNQAGKKVANGKVILAHLGSGASLAAVKDGKCMDTSMGFTPVSGLPMGTRCGDLDPSVVWYLMQFEKLNPKQFNHLINHESGLLGISETSADLRELMEKEYHDNRASEAIELFCYQTKKWIGSFAAVLEGLDTLVFAGGIGEHSPAIRSKICNGLGFLGIELDEIKNKSNAPVISTEKSKVAVLVIKTDEELMIAKLVSQKLDIARY